MYKIQLKKGIFEYGPFRKKTGLDLDHWLFDLLRRFGKVPIRKCCGTNNLHLKQGTYKVTRTPYGDSFNFEKYIIKTLKELGVFTDQEVIDNCCVGSPHLYVFKSFLYFTDVSNDNKSNVVKWLKRKLNEYQIGYTDPCCPPPYPVFQKFYVAFVDAGNTAGATYRKLYQTGCADNPTKGSLPWMIHMEDMDVNGTAYPIAPSNGNLIDPKLGLSTIMQQFENAAIPGATFTWVSADNGVVSEPYKTTTKNANYFWLVMTLPGNTNTVYSYETYYDSTPASAIPPINLAMSSMVVGSTDIFDYNNCNPKEFVIA